MLVLFTGVRRQKQPKCPSVDDRVKMWSILTSVPQNRQMLHLCVPAKSLQLCPTLLYPVDSSPLLQSTGLLCQWDSPGKNNGVHCPSFLQGNLPDPGTEPAPLRSLALAGGLFTLAPPG